MNTLDEVVKELKKSGRDVEIVTERYSELDKDHVFIRDSLDFYEWNMKNDCLSKQSDKLIEYVRDAFEYEN